MPHHDTIAANSSPLHLALIGGRLGHSFSKTYFERKFLACGMVGATYSFLEMPTLDGLRDAIGQQGLDGFNVTMPYKETIMPMLDDVAPMAATIGAVNAVKVTHPNGKLHLSGHNTDAPAFLATLKPVIKPHHTRALILGTGGAAKAVAWALKQLGIPHLFVSRTPSSHNLAISYDEAYRQHQSCHIIVNATPIGMSPADGDTPWQRPELLSPLHLCYDLIYNPSPTLFLKQASKQGATTYDGLAMLHLQADMAFNMLIC